MEGRMKTSRTILAAVAIVALATAANSAERGAGKSAARSGGVAGHEQSAAGQPGAGAHAIDIVGGAGDGSANLRRRAMRSSLIANARNKGPTVVPSATPVVHPVAPGTPAEATRNAIGVAAPANFALRSSATRPTGEAGANAANAPVGSNVGERHNPHLVPSAAAVNHPLNHPASLNGTEMGRSVTSPAALGGPAHVVSGIGGASVRPRH
jgi:hypothetical protein